jgi:hypothetical protein
MPTMDRLAGFATIAETATGFPGNNTHVPMENAVQAEVIRENGWAGGESITRSG